LYEEQSTAIAGRMLSLGILESLVGVAHMTGH
jgi:tRNA A37 threonylcarbamoyltransferase TsaD